MGSEQAPHRTVARGDFIVPDAWFVCLGPFSEQMLQCSFVLGSYLET